FPGSAAGVVLLPIMIYHALQLIVASILAKAMANWKPVAQPAPNDSAIR
ncbi:MAG: hypothetical protein EOO62_25945, partial [Hymenobacter sp.]